MSPEDMLNLTTKFAVKNGFITPTGQKKTLNKWYQESFITNQKLLGKKI